MPDDPVAVALGVAAGEHVLRSDRDAVIDLEEQRAVTKELLPVLEQVHGRPRLVVFAGHGRSWYPSPEGWDREPLCPKELPPWLFEDAHVFVATCFGGVFVERLHRPGRHRLAGAVYVVDELITGPTDRVRKLLLDCLFLPLADVLDGTAEWVGLPAAIALRAGGLMDELARDRVEGLTNWEKADLDDALFALQVRIRGF